MALSSGNKSLWEDIETLYGLLNTERIRFGYTGVSVPDEQNDIIDDQDIIDLKNYLLAMKNHKNLSSILNNAVISSAVEGQPIRANPVTEIQTVINQVRAQNATNVSGFNSSPFGANYSGHRSSFNSSFNSSPFGANYSGHRSSFNSGHRSSPFGANYSGHRGSNFGANYSGFLSTNFAGYNWNNSGCSCVRFTTFRA